MERFKNILLFLKGAGDQAILRRAASLAETNRAQLTVVTVTEELPRDMRMLIVALTPMELQELDIRKRREDLERIVAPLAQKGIQVSVNVLIGTPFLEIIRQVLRQKHDLVILAAEGRCGLQDRLHFIKGEPAEQIIDLAAQHAIDLIVMGTVCRTGVAGFFIGHTAEDVLQQVNCSVLTVKPDGFVSPVRLLKK